jgi:hypothetical protein
MRSRIVLLALALPAACGESATAPSSAENRDLENAAAMLDEAPDLLDAAGADGLGSNAAEPGKAPSAAGDAPPPRPPSP